MKKQLTGAEAIAQERLEQINVHGYTVTHDLQHNNNAQLTAMVNALMYHKYQYVPDDWNEQIVDKMMEKGYADRLVIAGALIAAEIDRYNEAVKNQF